MSFEDGDLIYFTYGRHKKLQNPNRSGFHRNGQLFLGRVQGSALPGFYKKDDERMENMYKVSHLNKEGTTEVYEDDKPSYFPIQEKTVSEQTRDGSLNWKDISIKNPRKIVVLTYQDCIMQTSDPCPYNGAPTTRKYKMMDYSRVLTKNPRCHKGRGSGLFQDTKDHPLVPVYLELVGIRKNLKPEVITRDDRPRKLSEYKMIVKVPWSSWHPDKEMPERASKTTYYLTPMGMHCAWFAEDYEEYIENLATLSELVHTSEPDQ